MSAFEASFRELAGAEPGAPLPDPGLLWWKAEIRRRIERQRRAARPVRIANAVAGAASIAAAVWFLADLWPQVSPQTRELAWSFLCYWLGLGSAAALALAFGRRSRSRPSS